MVEGRNSGHGQNMRLATGLFESNFHVSMSAAPFSESAGNGWILVQVTRLDHVMMPGYLSHRRGRVHILIGSSRFHRIRVLMTIERWESLRVRLGLHEELCHMHDIGTISSAGPESRLTFELQVLQKY